MRPIWSNTTPLGRRGLTFHLHRASVTPVSTKTVPSGLYDMRARWYDPETDAFTSVDPELSSTNQPYQYAGEDPVNGIDPSGEYSESAVTAESVNSGTDQLKVNANFADAVQAADGVG